VFATKSQRHHQPCCCTSTLRASSGSSGTCPALTRCSGTQAHLQYNIALCFYKMKQYGPALKHIAEIIERGVRDHPELSVGRCAAPPCGCTNLSVCRVPRHAQLDSGAMCRHVAVCPATACSQCERAVVHIVKWGCLRGVQFFTACIRLLPDHSVTCSGCDYVHRRLPAPQRVVAPECAGIAAMQRPVLAATRRAASRTTSSPAACPSRR
jgi:hypothetical protein